MSKPIELRESDFRRELNKYSYSDSMKAEFFDYWSEPDRAPQPKMRWEKEKTWDLGRRLARWAKTSKTAQSAPASKPAPPKIETDFDRLDAFIDEIRKPGSTVPFENFGKWYDFMKLNKLILPMTQIQINGLLTTYAGDKGKCRCAAVQLTLDHYVIHGLRIKDILNARMKLNEHTR